MVRYGSVIKFKKGVTREQAAQAIAQIGHLIELRKTVLEMPKGRTAARLEHCTERPATINDEVHEYDDQWGGPVWYIP